MYNDEELNEEQDYQYQDNLCESVISDILILQKVNIQYYVQVVEKSK